MIGAKIRELDECEKEEKEQVKSCDAGGGDARGGSLGERCWTMGHRGHAAPWQVFFFHRVRRLSMVGPSDLCKYSVVLYE